MVGEVPVDRSEADAVIEQTLREEAKPANLIRKAL